MTARCYIEEESAKQALKQLRSAEGEHRQHPVYFIDEPTRHYVVDDHGCITQYNWHTEQADRGYLFSGGWRVHKLRERSAADRELGALDWKGVKRRLDAGDVLRGYLYDLDHGSVRGWSQTVVFHKRSPQVAEGKKSPVGKVMAQAIDQHRAAASANPTCGIECYPDDPRMAEVVDRLIDRINLLDLSVDELESARENTPLDAYELCAVNDQIEWLISLDESAKDDIRRALRTTPRPLPDPQWNAGWGWSWQLIVQSRGHPERIYGYFNSRDDALARLQKLRMAGRAVYVGEAESPKLFRKHHLPAGAQEEVAALLAGFDFNGDKATAEWHAGLRRTVNKIQEVLERRYHKLAMNGWAELIKSVLPGLVKLGAAGAALSVISSFVRNAK